MATDLKRGIDQKVKDPSPEDPVFNVRINLSHHPLFIPNFPFFQPSIGPLALQQQTPSPLSDVNALPSELAFFNLSPTPYAPRRHFHKYAVRRLFF